MKRNTRKGQALPAGVEQMVQQLTSDAGWTDLALPPTQHEALRAIALGAREAAPATGARAVSTSAPARTSVTAVFAGSDSATRLKAASVLANELGVDLYRVDLSRVASKYIGETEKNLERVFDAAEKADAVLFFDEADALFGKRSDVKDSHDRFANTETNYLLERLEKFQGIAILATNRKASLDDAFVRRIRYLVDFTTA